jgi:hypothetical protein
MTDNCLVCQGYTSQFASRGIRHGWKFNKTPKICQGAHHLRVGFVNGRQANEKEAELRKNRAPQEAVEILGTQQRATINHAAADHFAGRLHPTVLCPA